MRIIAVTQARTDSTRLPGKVLKKIGHTTLLELHIQRVLKSRRITELVLATTTTPEDVAIIEIANKCKVACYCGSVDDVLDRYYQSVQGLNPDYVVRLTSDCPLIDAGLIDKIIQYTIAYNLDYCSNTLDPQYPDGQDVEVFKYTALKKAWNEAVQNSEREHVTPYIWKNSTFKGGTLFASKNFSEGFEYGYLRMTVDEEIDLEVITKIISAMGSECTWLEYAQYFEKSAELKKLNESIYRNEGYTKSITKESNANE